MPMKLHLKIDATAQINTLSFTQTHQQPDSSVATFNNFENYFF